ncbi:hypothetical protein GGF46_004029 [Coemansia sp. RSA 552]|nr:hypothetical protein GGF46_004029 [Coemansia sp. RSA 552]
MDMNGSTPSSDERRDSGRHSMGLGIVLTGDGGGLRRALGEMEFSAQPVSSGAQGRQEEAGASSLFSRVFSGIAAFMSTVDDNNQPGTQEKSRTEDMLEAYYMSQGRDVPAWVYNPPEDPPMSLEPPGTGVESPGPRTRDSDREVSSKPSSIGTNSVLRSFAKLNISRLGRPPHAVRESSSGPGNGEPSSSDSRIRRIMSTTHTASLKSRARSSKPSSVEPSRIAVQMVDSASSSSSRSYQESLGANPDEWPRYALESTQLSSGPTSKNVSPAVSRHPSFFYVPRRGLAKGKYVRRSETPQRSHSTSEGIESPAEISPPLLVGPAEYVTPVSPHRIVSEPAPGSLGKRRQSIMRPAWASRERWRRRHAQTTVEDTEPGPQTPAEPQDGQRSKSQRTNKVKRFFQRKG